MKGSELMNPMFRQTICSFFPAMDLKFQLVPSPFCLGAPCQYAPILSTDLFWITRVQSLTNEIAERWTDVARQQQR